MDQQQPLKPEQPIKKKPRKKWWIWLLIMLFFVFIIAYIAIPIISNRSTKEVLCELLGGVSYAYNFDELNYNIFDTKCLKKAGDGGNACRSGSDCKSGVCYTSPNALFEVEIENAGFDSDGYLLGKCSDYQLIKDCPSGEDCILGCYIPIPVKSSEIDEVVRCEQRPID